MGRLEPLEFGHRALHGDRLVGVEHGEGMMRYGGRGEGRRRDGGQTGKSQVHERLSISPNENRCYTYRTAFRGRAAHAASSPLLQAPEFQERGRHSVRFRSWLAKIDR